MGIGRRLIFAARNTWSSKSLQQDFSILTTVMLAISLWDKIFSNRVVMSKSEAGQQISGSFPLDNLSWKLGQERHCNLLRSAGGHDGNRAKPPEPATI